MNELQQVLIIFAVVVIAGLYFLSRSRQNELKKNASDPSSDQNISASQKTVDQPVISHSKVKLQAQQPAEVAGLNQAESVPDIAIVAAEDNKEIKDSVVNNDLQEETIAAPEEVETFVEQDSEQPVAEERSKKLTAEEAFNQNQGTLFFGDEFDLPSEDKTSQLSTEPESSDSVSKHEILIDDLEPLENAGKHHVLVVDDPGLNGEMDESMVPTEHIKPSFGIPEEELQNRKVLSGTNKEPQAFVIMMLTTGKNFKMADVNQALHGVGLKLSEEAIFVKSDANGKPFIKVANMLEPGTFPVEDLENYETPGVVMILELPTTVRAPAAMDDLILIARKISQRLGGRLYDMERHLIRESDFQTMRDTALDYESEPLT